MTITSWQIEATKLLAARYWYPDYYKKYRNRIDKAFEYLCVFLEDTKSFPYEQTTSWERCREEYYQALGKVKQF